jgi:hypothetical protein
MTWQNINPPIFIFVNLDKGSIFVGNGKKQVFTIKTTDPEQYHHGFVIYTYLTEDTDGKECNVAYTVFDDPKHETMICLKYPTLYYCYEMHETTE